MQATKVRAKNQVTLPAGVLKSAGVAENDLLDWRFESGEIRAVKLAPKLSVPKPYRARLIEREGKLVFDVPFKVIPEAIVAAVHEDQERQ